MAKELKKSESQGISVTLCQNDDPLFHVVFLQIRHDFHISNVLCLFAFHIFYWPWIEYIGDVKHLLRWEDTSEDNCKK